MKIPLLIFCIILTCDQLFINTQVSGQTLKEIDVFYLQKRYDEALSGCKLLIEKQPEAACPNAIIGEIYFNESKFDSSLPFFQKAISLDNDSTSISGWAHYFIGCSYYALGDKAKGIYEIRKCYELGFTDNSTTAAKNYLDSIGYELPEKKYEKNYLPNWVVIHGKNITYKFQDTIGITNAVYKYIEMHEQAYDSINKIFEAKLPSKLIFHIWNDKEIGNKITHNRVEFAAYEGCFTHVTRDGSVGYYMTFCLAYWAWGTKPSGYSKFIRIGISVGFNLTDYDKYALARRIVAKEKIENVLDVWANEKKYDAKVLNPIAGAFITYIYQNLPQEQFKNIVKIQSLEQVKLLLGNQFDKIVTDFNNLLLIKS